MASHSTHRRFGESAARPTAKSRAEKSDSPGAQRHSLFWRFRRFFFYVGVLVLATGVGALWAASQVQVPTTNPIIDQTSFVCTAEVTHNCNESNAVASLHGNVNRVVVPLSAVSPEMQNAILAAEDKNFFSHGGVDPVGIARAAWIDIRGGGGTHGGSTLTQQYVKLTYLTSQRTFQRKLKEAVLSVKLEQKLSKKQIFERYLNLVYFGRGAYGVQAAAQVYFGTDAKSLTLPQAAFLAGIVRNPGWASDPSMSRSLRKLVLTNMYDDKMINAAQRDAADTAPIDLPAYKPSPGVNWLGGSLGSHGKDPYGTRYFVQSVINQLERKLGSNALFNGGLRIYTTLQPQRQRDAYNAVTSVLNFGDHPAGALVAMDNDGRVVAMMGGTDYAADQVNLATGEGGGGGRQVGSTFKPFALAELVKQGYSIGSSVPAAYKMTFTKADYPSLGQDEYTVESDCCTGGAASMIDATAQSINSSYVRTMLALGPANVDGMARSLGVTKSFPPHVANVLGSVSIPVIDIASAYSTFARGGVQLAPVLVDRVSDRNDNVLASYKSSRHMVLSPSQNAKVVYALQQVVQRGTGTAADIGRPTAGKTGTVAANGQSSGSDDSAGTENSDAWFTGFVPGFTASVWMGYQSGNKPMPSSYQGATYPAEIWRAFMQAALAGVPKANFPTPVDLMGGKFLTSWGGTHYAEPAWTVKDYENGASPSGGSSNSAGTSGNSTNNGNSGNNGNSTSGSQSSSGSGGGPPTTTHSGGGGGGGGPATTAPPGTSPPVTAAPPPATAAPVTQPSPGNGGGGGAPSP